MTAKDKANDLVKKYWLKNRTGQDDFKTAINNALICVDEVINSNVKPSTNYTIDVIENINYWQEVKVEIENL